MGISYRKYSPFIFVGLWALAIALLIALAIELSDGHLIYTLDDPYIHLAVAENVIRGVYGVNMQELSSPSSSAIYPFILALTEALGLGGAGPLLVNLIAAGLSVWLLLDFFWSYAVPADGNKYAFPFLLSLLLVFLISALALPMTGMEHSLHVLAVVLVMRGLVLTAETDRVGPCFFVAIILMPLLRFEGIALAAAVILALAILGRGRVALLLLLLLGLVFGVYTSWMLALDLPALPSSVMQKSALAAKAESGIGLFDLARTLVEAIWLSLNHRAGVLLALTICALSVVVRRANGPRINPRSPEVLVALASALALAAHIVAGAYGWFWRYEVYAFAIAAMALIYVFRSAISALQTRRLYGAQLALLLTTAVVVVPYVRAAYETPTASRGIYEQHYQMHRFATDFFPRTVAVNDLGWVSYRNDMFVLDLGGLGSEQVRRLRAENQFDAEVIERLVQDQGVDYAMIYAEWFSGIVPKSWCLVAILKSQKVSAAYGEVLFYATHDGSLKELQNAVASFRPSLPERVVLEDVTCDGSSP